MATNDEHKAIERAQEAWASLKRGQSWEHWLSVGVALVIGRGEAMRAAHTNAPAGRGYNEAFSGWLSQYEFADIDKADRSHLFACMEHRSSIETWRATLTQTERLKLNHPKRVMEKWKASTRVPLHGEKAPSAMAKLKDENEALRQKCARLEHQVGDGGNLWRSGDTAGDIARVLADHLVRLTESKAERVLNETKKFLKDSWEKRK